MRHARCVYQKCDTIMHNAENNAENNAEGNAEKIQLVRITMSNTDLRSCQMLSGSSARWNRKEINLVCLCRPCITSSPYCGAVECCWLLIATRCTARHFFLNLSSKSLVAMGTSAIVNRLTDRQERYMLYIMRFVITIFVLREYAQLKRFHRWTIDSRTHNNVCKEPLITSNGAMAC